MACLKIAIIKRERIERDGDNDIRQRQRDGDGDGGRCDDCKIRPSVCVTTSVLARPREAGTGTGTGKPLGRKRPCGSCIINFSSFHFLLPPAAVKLHCE